MPIVAAPIKELNEKDAAEAAEAKKRGPAVLDHKLRYLSVSQVTAFDPHQVGGCNRRWYFEKVMGIKGPDTIATNTGKEVHAQIEHYLKTSEPTLSILTLQARRFIPEPGPGLLIEHPFGDADLVLALEVARNKGDALEVERLSKKQLVASGVPFIGYIDVVNQRGSWINDDGDLNLDLPNSVELLDWKTSSNIQDFGKKAHELEHTVQMPGYARWASLQWPELKHFRLSHGYIQTKKRGAEKRSAVIHLDVVQERWESIESTVREMVDVAKETEPLNVEPNFGSCTMYRGCPHRTMCPDSFENTNTNHFADSSFKKEDDGEPTMSGGLFSKMGMIPAAAAPTASKSLFATGATVAPTPAPVVKAPVNNPTPVAVLEEMAKLQALETRVMAQNTAPTPPPPPVAPAAPTKSLFTAPALTTSAAKSLEDRIAALSAKVNTAPALTPTEALVPVSTPKATPVKISAVLPPDAPSSDLAKSAEPVPAEVMGTLSPEVQAAAEITNAAVAAITPPAAPGAEPAKKGRKSKGTDEESAKIIAALQLEVETLKAECAMLRAERNQRNNDTVDFDARVRNIINQVLAERENNDN